MTYISPILTQQDTTNFGMVVIYDQVLSADAAFDVQNIPQSYKHLLIIGSLRSTESSILSAGILRLNGDSGNNYDWQDVKGRNASAVVADSQATTFGLCSCPGANAAAGIFAATMALIPDYASIVTEKSVSVFGGYADEAAAGGEASVQCSHWRNTAAINRIQVIGSATGLFLAGSRLTIYGLGGAPAIPLTGIDGWVDDSANAWTYISATSFSVLGNRTDVFSKGTRIKVTDGSVKYFVVTNSSFGAGITTVTITGGSDYSLSGGTLSSNAYSYAANPQGYPTWFAYTPTEVGWSSLTRSNARFQVIGRQCYLELDFVGTSDNTETTLTLPIATASTFYPYNVGWFINNSVNGFGRWYFSDTTTLKAGPSATTDIWTASGTKNVGIFTGYEI